MTTIDPSTTTPTAVADLERGQRIRWQKDQTRTIDDLGPAETKGNRRITLDSGVSFVLSEKDTLQVVPS